MAFTKRRVWTPVFVSKTIFHFINLSIFIFIYYLFAVVLYMNVNYTCEELRI